MNLGANRYSFQFGLPTGFIFYQSFFDPTLTTLELLPTVTVYEANTQPFGATRVTKAPQFALGSKLNQGIEFIVGA